MTDAELADRIAHWMRVPLAVEGGGVELAAQAVVRLLMRTEFRTLAGALGRLTCRPEDYEPEMGDDPWVCFVMPL